MLGGWLDTQQGRLGGVHDPDRSEPHSHRGGATADLEGAGDLVGCQVDPGHPAAVAAHPQRPVPGGQVLGTTPTGISARVRPDLGSSRWLDWVTELACQTLPPPAARAPSASVGTVSALRLVAGFTRTIG
jgi:hypothetical protein